MQKDELKQIVLSGSDLAKDGVLRWRCVDLQRVIPERYKVKMAERTVALLPRDDARLQRRSAVVLGVPTAVPKWR